MLSGPKSTQFTQPEDHLAQADATTLGAIVAAASDIALVIGRDDTVQDFAIGAEGLDGERFAEWAGRPVETTLTIESRTKVRELIAGARRGEPVRWREVNHPLGEGRDDLPVRYRAIRADESGRVLLLGRDLRPVAALQRRLVSAQQSLERDYTRLLQMETRYRLLLQSANEAFLIVDAATGRVQEANRPAAQLLGHGDGELTRRKFPLGFDATGARTLEAVMASVRASGQAESVSVATAEGGTEIEAFISLFRAESARLFLIRLTERSGSRFGAGSEIEAEIVEMFRRACEAIVLTDGEGLIEWANDTFLEMVQVAVESQIKGERLDRFFTRQGIDLPLILANTRDTGRLRFYTTSLSGTHGTVTEVEVSAVHLPDNGPPGYGLVFRNTAFRPSEATSVGVQLPRSAEQLTELIGRVPMKDLVRETVDVIERLCIEAALQMTDDNRASAADLLGLSRQSLYVKLRRYGLSDGDSDNSA
ncbi:MAG: transcriptional regulator PpsR [Pseudomonadota bacterium]